MVRLRIFIQDLSLQLLSYDKIKIFRLLGEVYEEITTAETRLDLIAASTVYYYNDEDGTESSSYKYSLLNSVSSDESSQSDEFKSKNIGEKVGYTFMNYASPPEEWGEALTPDDIRFTYFWGIDLKSSDISESDINDSQLAYCVNSALNMWEKELNIDVRRRVYKTKPSSDLKRARYWRQGVQYTDEEDPYDWDKVVWNNWGFLKLRRRPVLSIERAEMFDILGNKMLDVKDWIRLYKKAGQVSIYPKGNLSLGKGYAGSGIMYPLFKIVGDKYPHAFEIDYTTGFESSDFIPDDLREAMGITAAILALEFIGDGLLAGFSSSGLGLDGLSESFSSTQSATSAYFGARILSYINFLKEFRKTNKAKYCNISIGFI